LTGVAELPAPASHGTLVVENHHATAKLQLNIISVAEGFEMLQMALLDPKIDPAKFKLPDIQRAVVAPGEAWKAPLTEGQYEVTAEGIPPEAFPSTTRRPWVTKGQETRVIFEDQREAVFQSLFNGKDLSGWQPLSGGDVKNWKVVGKVSLNP